jgi:hypothetical protein
MLIYFFHILNTMSSVDNIDWNDLKGKEARGVNDADLGEVQEVRGDIVVTKTGIVDKKVYNIPKNLVQGYDGHNVIFRLTKEEAKNQYEMDI